MPEITVTRYAALHWNSPSLYGKAYAWRRQARRNHPGEPVG